MEQNDICPVCTTILTGLQRRANWTAYNCPRCGEFRLTTSLESTLPGHFDRGIHRRALMSHKLRRMTRVGEEPPKISTYTVDSFWTDEVMPTPAKQADDLILWVGDNQLSHEKPVRVEEYSFLSA